MGERLFHFLLRLYPAPFRHRYAANMLDAFRAEQAARGRFRVWTSVIVDFVKTVPRAWYGRLTAGPPPGQRIRSERQLMHLLIQDLRYAIRSLMRNPGTGVTAVLTLALGIGLTAAMFSIVNGIVLEGLPVEEPQEVMAISRMNPQESANRLAGRVRDFVDLRERQRTFDDLAAVVLTPMNVSPPDGPPEFLSGARVTASMFSLLGVAPAMGRGLVPSDEQPGAGDVIVISHEFWRGRLDGDPAALGASVRVNGQPRTVVGVMPPQFAFPFNQDLWEPLRLDPMTVPRGEGPVVFMVGRLRDGVALAAGQADLAAIMDDLGVAYPSTNAGMTVMVAPYVREVLGYQVPPLLFTMLGAVGLVLLIACANVANLQLARASTRTKELAVRTALGASRRRLAIQMLVETAVIAAAGAGLGLGLAQAAVVAFNRALQGIPQGIPFWFAIDIDPTVLAVVAGLTVMATLLAGTVPALRSSGTDVNAVLKDEARGSSSLQLGRFSRGLVIMEVAFSCALLIAAGLTIKSVQSLASFDYAFATRSVLTGAVSLPEHNYADAAARRQFATDLLDRIRAVPGVENAALGSDMPVVGFGNGRFAIEGVTYQADRDYPNARISSITSDYFRTFETAMREGRAFAPSDNANSLPVAVVNESFAREHFPDGAMGRRVRIRGTLEREVDQATQGVWYTVVGVAPDLYLEFDAFVLPVASLYLPFAQRPSSTVSLAIRTSGDPLSLTPDVRRAIGAIDQDLPLVGVDTLDGTIRSQQWLFNVFGAMFSIFGAVALFLATVGLYGVLAFTVNQRSQEMGLRTALGANPGRVIRHVVRRGVGQLAIGLGIGVVMAFGLARTLTILLFDVSATDPLVFLGIPALLVLTSVAAMLIPAHRATQVDPMDAMRR